MPATPQLIVGSPAPPAERRWPGPRRVKICPCCGRPFGCHAGGCWCDAVEIDATVRKAVRARFRECLCADCLRRLAAAGVAAKVAAGKPSPRRDRGADRLRLRPARAAADRVLRGRDTGATPSAGPVRARGTVWRATLCSLVAHTVVLAVWALQPCPFAITPPVPLAMESETVGLRLRLSAGDGSGDGPGGAGAAEPAPLGGPSRSRPPLQAMTQPIALPPAPLAVRMRSADSAISADAQQFAAAIAASALPGPVGDGGSADGRADGVAGGRGSGSGSGEPGLAGRSGSGGGGGGGPGYLHNPVPPYPRLARERGWEGTTLLRVEVRADGTSGRIEVLKSSGYPVLDESATSTVARWRFRPARSRTGAVAAVVEIPISFRMVSEVTTSAPKQNESAGVSLAAAP